MKCLFILNLLKHSLLFIVFYLFHNEVFEKRNYLAFLNYKRVQTLQLNIEGI